MTMDMQHIHAEMDALPALTSLIEMLAQAAPSSRLFNALREALRHAHPACFDVANNVALHLEHAKSRGYELQLPVAALPAPVAAVQPPQNVVALPDLRQVLMSISERLSRLEHPATPATVETPATPATPAP